MADHALLSPSASHRWLNCTAAPLLESRVPDEDTVYAQEGTLAHAYCAKALKNGMGCDTSSEEKEIARLRELYTPDMDEYVETYRAVVMGKYEDAREKTPDARLMVETRLDFTDWIPDSFGTADAMIIADGVLDVVDFKYGKGVRVDAENNPQMMIYALGALEMLGMEYGIKQVNMTIVQPRLASIATHIVSVEELQRWAKEVLKPKAREALAGGTQKAGEWCKFCKVRKECRALATMAVEAYESVDVRGDALLDADEVAALLPKLPVIRTWLSDLEEYALVQALQGTKFHGWKVVEGRSVRKIVDEPRLVTNLKEEGFTDEAIYKPRELKALTNLESLVGRKKFATCAEGCISRPKGKPTLVPESDKRQPYSLADDFSDI